MESSPMMAVVDTHTLIWYFEGKPSLGKKAKEIMLNQDVELIVPVIVLCEFLYYLRKSRRQDAYQTVLGIIMGNPKYKIVPIISEHVSIIPPHLEMHDGLIAACLQSYPQAILLSRDPDLKKWGRERVVW